MKNLKIFRRKKGYTQKFMGELLGMTQQGYASYENNKTSPDPGTLVKISRILGCSAEQLLGCDSPIETAVYHNKIPLLTGSTNPASRPFTDEIVLDSPYSPEAYFAMRITGEAMHPYYMDGDIVIARRQSTADDGDDVVVCISTATAVVKRFQRSALGITLRNLNAAGESQFFTQTQIEGLPLQIIGVVIELRRKI